MEGLRFLGDLVPGWTDVVQILVVAVLVHRILRFMSRTRALRILLGVVVIALIYWGSQLLNLELLVGLMETTFQYGAIAALIVFQPELRYALDRMGRGTRLLRLFKPVDAKTAAEVVEASRQLSVAGRGGIIAVERGVRLDQYGEIGVRVDAPVSADLVSSIFSPGSPLHDGAVIVSGDQIKFARAILPLSRRERDDRLGTRHRAALGLSEESDAIVIVVSEETSKVSLAVGGVLERQISYARVKEALMPGAVESS